MKYTREQLVEMGMSETQIGAILATYEAEDKSKDESNSVIAMPAAPLNKVVPGPGEVVPVNCEEAMKVTNVFDLQNYSKGTVVRFPDFAEGQPFVARVRRPSMLVLAKQGKIPNSLLTAAGELFSKGGSGMDTDNEHMLEQMYDLCHIICEATLIEPTLQDIEGAGIELSDDQITAIFNYTQSGVRALESFRKK